VITIEQTLNPDASTVKQVKKIQKRKFRKDVTVLPVPGSIICSVCNASYDSQTKLRDHQRMAHRSGGTEGKPQATAVVVQSEDQSEI